MGNKSVLIVKPNQFGLSASVESNLGQSRNSKRKISSDHDNKENRYSLNNKDLSGYMKDSAYANEGNIQQQMRNSKGIFNL